MVVTGLMPLKEHDSARQYRRDPSLTIASHHCLPCHTVAVFVAQGIGNSVTLQRGREVRPVAEHDTQTIKEVLLMWGEFSIGW